MGKSSASLIPTRNKVAVMGGIGRCSGLGRHRRHTFGSSASFEFCKTYAGVDPGFSEGGG